MRRHHGRRHAGQNVGCALLVAFAIGCGGQQHADEPTFVEGPHVPAELAVPDGATVDLALTPTGTSVDELAAHVLEALDERAIVAFAPALPDGSDALQGVVRYVSFVENVDEVAVQHTVFVVAGPWSADLERAFVRAFWPMPSRVAAGGARPLFHFAGPTAPTPTIAYLFGNQWWGALESTMLGVLATLPEDEAGVAALEVELRTQFSNFGFDVSAGDGGDGLAALLAALPSREGDLRPPAGTLVAAGLLLGAELIATDAGLAWTRTDDGAATFFGLAVDGDASVLLRPIDFMLQAWESGVADPVHGYLELAAEHIAAFRGPGVATGE